MHIKLHIDDFSWKKKYSTYIEWTVFQPGGHVDIFNAVFITFVLCIYDYSISISTYFNFSENVKNKYLYIVYGMRSSYKSHRRKSGFLHSISLNVFLCSHLITSNSLNQLLQLLPTFFDGLDIRFVFPGRFHSRINFSLSSNQPRLTGTFVPNS